MIYEFRRGATILLALDAMRGDPASVSAIDADLKAVGPGGTVAEDAPVVASFDIAPRAASGGLPGGWTLSIAAAISETLELGLYRTDGRLTVAGGTIFTDPVDIRITEPLTGPQP
jgi:hypothetical protein